MFGKIIRECSIYIYQVIEEQNLMTKETVKDPFAILQQTLITRPERIEQNHII